MRVALVETKVSIVIDLLIENMHIINKYNIIHIDGKFIPSHAKATSFQLKTYSELFGKR
jgi:hypothetical protein